MILSKRPAAVKQADLLADLRASCISLATVARRAGVSKQAVHQQAHRGRLTARVVRAATELLEERAATASLRGGRP